MKQSGSKTLLGENAPGGVKTHQCRTGKRRERSASRVPSREGISENAIGSHNTREKREKDHQKLAECLFKDNRKPGLSD